MVTRFVFEEIEETIEFFVGGRPEEPPGEATEEGERKPGRRRRRRRRGRGRSGERAPEAPRETETWDVESRPARESVDDDIADQEIDDSDETDGPAVAEREAAPREGEEERAGRPRRRRRRRGRRGGEAREPSAPATGESRQEREPEDLDDDIVPAYAGRRSESFDDEEDDDDDLDLKAHHRGIPTWDDAIGMIVNTNMESRARNPAGSSGPRGRRGRGHGRSHNR